MRKGLFLFVFLISMGLHAQQYTVHRNQFVYEIKDSTGRSVYQCFADTVMLMYKLPYAYILRGDKIGLYSMRYDSLILNPVYDEIRINRSVDRVQYFDSSARVKLNNNRFDLLEITTKDKYIADLVGGGPVSSVLKTEFYGNNKFMVFQEDYHAYVTDPYHRFLRDGTRIDSLWHDKMGNLVLDSHGNPIYLYPPGEINNNSFLLQLNNLNVIKKSGFTDVWIAKNKLIWSNDSLVEVYNGNQLYLKSNWTDIYSNKTAFNQFYRLLVPDNVIMSSERLTDTVLKNSFNDFELVYCCQCTMTIFDSLKAGMYEMYNHVPYYRIHIQPSFEYVVGQMVIVSDTLAYAPLYALKPLKPDVWSIGAAFYRYTETGNDTLQEKVKYLLERALAGIDVNFYGYKNVNGKILFNWFESGSLNYESRLVNNSFLGARELCLDENGSMDKNCPFNNIHNLSGIYDLQRREWVLDPVYSAVIFLSDVYIVYRLSNVANKNGDFGFKLESGIFDGTKWKIPMAEQFLLEEKGVLYKVVNGKKIPVTTK